MNIGDNILKIRKKKGLSAEKLANKIGVSKQMVYQYESGKSIPGQEVIANLAREFNISVSELYSNEVQFRVDRHDHVSNKIPFYDTITVGGHAMLADQSAIDQPSEMIEPGTFLRGATGALRVYGHSMYPKYPSGCIVAFKASSTAIPSVIIWGEDYVIELEDRRIIKKVDKGETKDSIKAISLNGTNGDKVKYQYDTLDIPLNAIKRMYMVMGKIELEASI